MALGQEMVSNDMNIKLLPSIFHTPETSWGIGGIVLAFYQPIDSLTGKSNAQLYFDATLNKQLSFQSDFNLFTNKNKYFIRGSHDLSKFPEFYFGIGNNTLKSDHCLINIAYFDIKTDLFRNIGRNRFLGIKVHHQNLIEIDKPIEQDRVTINELGYVSTGFGLSFLMDRRNNLLNPTQGHYLETKAMKYSDQRHVSSGFYNFMVDARHYVSFKKTVLNTNAYLVNNKGAVPFRMMPSIGGPRFLRGYYAGRFRDNNLAVLQAEVRRPIFWRMGVAVFSGIGQVYEKAADFHFNQFHYNYGAGLRFLIDKKSNANVRLDYGRTKDSQGVYIVFAECF